MFQRLAHERIEDAEALYAAGRYSAAYYLAGYSIECALKAAICRKLQRHTLPARSLLNNVFNHELEKLLIQSDLSTDFTLDGAARPLLAANWATLRDWNESKRYQRNSRLQARDIIRAVHVGPDSMLPWLVARW